MTSTTGLISHEGIPCRDPPVFLGGINLCRVHLFDRTSHLFLPEQPDDPKSSRPSHWVWREGNLWMRRVDVLVLGRISTSTYQNLQDMLRHMMTLRLIIVIIFLTFFYLSVFQGRYYQTYKIRWTSPFRDGVVHWRRPMYLLGLLFLVKDILKTSEVQYKGKVSFWRSFWFTTTLITSQNPKQ